MKRSIYYAILSSLLLTSCVSDKATVKISLNQVPDSTELIISKLDFNKVVDVDTLYTDRSRAGFSAEVKEGAPDFYYITHDGRKLVSLVLQKGDKLDLQGSLDGIDRIEGSAESVKFNGLEQDYLKAYRRFDSLSTLIRKAEDDRNTELEKNLQKQLAEHYVKYKRSTITYIYSNSKSITTIPPLYYRISDALPVFADKNDFLFYKRVYDSLQTVFPRSPYILSLANDLERVDRLLQLNTKLSEAKTTTFPDISLLDNKGRAQSLSQFEGKVILLQFWTAFDTKQKIFNNDLKTVYEKYHSKGLEIYQVALDRDKMAWANSVQEQQLPWTCVCDPYGPESQFLPLYNVTQLPALFLIDKSGIIVSKNEFDLDKLGQLINKALK